MKRTISLLLCLCLLAALTVGAAATNFTPSVESKAAPTVVETTGQDGNTYAAVINDAANGETGVPFGDLIVTPVSEEASADESIRETLESAYQELSDSAVLVEILDSTGLTSALSSAGIDVEDVVVGDLFDVTVIGTYAEALAQEGATITITFELSRAADSLVGVLHKSDAGWESVAYTVVGENAVSITCSSLSPFAFLYDGGELSVDENGPTSPKTGGSDLSGGILAAGAAVALLAAGTVVLYKKKIA